MKIKDLTEDYQGEFRMKAAYGLQLMANCQKRIDDLTEDMARDEARINKLEDEMSDIGDREVEDVVMELYTWAMK